MSEHHSIGDPSSTALTCWVRRPASLTTSPVISARRLSSASPSRRMYSPRCFGVGRPHGPSSNASRAAATALAERITAAAAIPPSDMKLNNGDRSSRPETLARGNGEKNAPAPANDTDFLVAVLMARPDIKSVSDLTGKNIAIDNRYSASNGSVRTAIVAAGATMVELSEGQATAINRLVNGEVPAAVLALVSADAAEGFPEIPGFKIFHIPLSLRSLKVQP